MTLIVEDGTGLSTAESYISVAGADTRHTNLGNAAWTGSTAVKEAALRNATVYLEQAYRTRWIGNRNIYTQALSWPRWNAQVDGFPVRTDAVPPEVANACADLALKALAGELNADLTRAITREKVGPLETDYNPYSPQSVRYRAIDMMLIPYLKGSAMQASVMRA